MKALSDIVVPLVLLALAGTSASAPPTAPPTAPAAASRDRRTDGPSTLVRTEYLMTIYAPLDPAAEIDPVLAIYNINGGGWARGPRISGKFVPPGGDWSRLLPSGATRIDVRATLKTDDGALIYISYGGVLRESRANEEKSSRGEVLTDKDIEYFVTAPTFETAAPKYAWLNGIQAVGKMVEIKDGKGGYVKYDLFTVL